MSVANAEEATNIANEYISSVDNLSNEVQFLLGEIKRKDELVADIESKALKKSNDIFGRRNNGPLTPREQASIEKTREYHERISKLNEEKVQLARDLQRIAARAVGRLDYDLQRIRRATGDLTGYAPDAAPPPPVTPSQSFKITQSVVAAQAAASNNLPLAAAIVTPVAPPFTPQLPVQVPEVPPPPAVQLTAQKRRRLNGTASVLASATNTAPVTLTSSPAARARPSAQAQAASPAPAPRKREAVRAPTIEFEEENEEDEAPPDEEDNNPYCYCHQPSHGEMVACDGANCPYEWFHLACLGMKHAPKNSKWFCSDCSAAAEAEGQAQVEKAASASRKRK